MTQEMSGEHVTVKDILEAKDRISSHIRETPLIQSEFLSDYCGGEVLLKLENQQKTGSFKIRGALNKLLQLTEAELERGVITASTGNHAQGVGFAAQLVGTKASVVVPKSISSKKLQSIQQYNMEVIKTIRAEDIEYDAIQLAQVKELVYVSPYNEPAIIAGQGTIGLELLDQTSDFDTVIIPVGGGGLISGISLALKSRNPAISVHGVQSKAATAMYSSLKKGEVVAVQEDESLAEALLGGLIKEAMTLELMQDLVDWMQLVSEKSIRDAIRVLWTMDSQVVEGAGAVPVAYILENADLFKDMTTVAIISGGNISDELLKDIIKTN
ncbi:MAG: pyridoxal-phosphate dependent enzyme [Candidatus Lokiarchaeota archaeon]|nr:pyridoxal-phosphate dependent enzyme [Candidatus Lokiarchaeota archaeon]